MKYQLSLEDCCYDLRLINGLLKCKPKLTLKRLGLWFEVNKRTSEINDKKIVLIIKLWFEVNKRTSEIHTVGGVFN